MFNAYVLRISKNLPSEIEWSFLTLFLSVELSGCRAQSQIGQR
jgi:hypothetical protein